MADTIEVRLIGFERMMANVKPEVLVGPVRRFLDRATISIGDHIKEFTPVDTGRLYTSIGGGTFRGGSYPPGHGRAIDASPVPGWASVGTNVEYAEELEFSVHKKPRPGGVGRIPYFRPGITAARPDITKSFEKMGQEIREGLTK